MDSVEPSVISQVAPHRCRRLPSCAPAMIVLAVLVCVLAACGGQPKYSSSIERYIPKQVNGSPIIRNNQYADQLAQSLIGARPGVRHAAGALALNQGKGKTVTAPDAALVALSGPRPDLLEIQGTFNETDFKNVKTTKINGLPAKVLHSKKGSLGTYGAMVSPTKDITLVIYTFKDDPKLATTAIKSMLKSGQKS